MTNDEIKWEKEYVRLETKRRINFEYLTVPPDCENCGSADNIEIHHYNYNDPDRVRSLCRKCHKKWHTLYEPIQPIMINGEPQRMWDACQKPILKNNVHQITNEELIYRIKREKQFDASVRITYIRQKGLQARHRIRK